MRLGFLVGAAVGGVWGLIWMPVIGVTFMFVSGNIVLPAVGAAGLAAALAGAGYMLIAPMRRTMQTHIGLALVFLALLAGLSGGRPFGVELDDFVWQQGLSLLIIAELVGISVWLCVGDLSAGPLSRYRLEVALLKLTRGLGMVFFTVIVVLPFYVMVMTSLKSQQALLANPLDFSLDLERGWDQLIRSYVELFDKFEFGTFLVNSALVSIATVIITLCFAVPGAYAVARLRFPGREFLANSILLIYMIPAIVLVIPLFAVFSQLGLRNSLGGLIIVYPATTIPVAIYMLQGYFRSLPSELEDAGIMDGLSQVGVIGKITLPLSLPALASVALYVFMIAWNEFLFAFMFLDNIELFTLSRGIVSLNSSEVPRQHLMAGAVVATVPVLLVFLWFERYLVAGLTAGAVKG